MIICSSKYVPVKQNTGTTTKGKSQTIPGMSMPLKTMLEKFCRGERLPDGNMLEYDGEDEEVTFDMQPECSFGRDLTDIDIQREYSKQLKNEVEFNTKKIKEMQKNVKNKTDTEIQRGLS